MPRSKLWQEIKTFETHRAELVDKHYGEFVLIKGEEIIGTYPTEQKALAAGYKRLGYVPFFVRKIAAVDEVISIYTSPK